jgi:uncharacterized OsmC-like protein
MGTEQAGRRRAARGGSEHEVVVDVQARHLEKVHHAATVRHFTMESDEPPGVGGDDRHPNPLGYFLAGLAF